eukprot:360852_1
MSSGSKLYYSPKIPIAQQSEEQKLYFEFIQSIYKGDPVAFDALVDRIPNFNADAGWPPIMHAVHKDRVRFVQTLIERGADIHVVDRKKARTLLHNACEHGYTEMVDLLLSRNVEINTIDSESESPLWTCCRKGYDDIVELLLNPQLNQQTCNITLIKTANGQSALFVVCDRGYIKIVKLLLDYKRMKCDIDAADVKSRTPLIRACTKGHEKIVKLLLHSGANVNLTNFWNQNCLMAAFRVNKTKICNIILNTNYESAVELWRHDSSGKYILDYKTPKSDKKIVSQIQSLIYTMLKSALLEFDKEWP